MKFLVACEESQAVTIELRKLGHEAYSCDLEPCSGGHPEWHLQQDVIPLLNEYWDGIIAFPPCTYLAVSGASWLKDQPKRGKGLVGAERRETQKLGAKFFMLFINSKCKKVGVENPIGVMSTWYRKPDQIIHPYMFGDPFSKPTCIWVKGFPKLIIPPKELWASRGEFLVSKNGKRGAKWNWGLPPSADRARIRSKTFPGIAKAIAEQWSKD